MPNKQLYTIPKMEDANRLARIASDALQVARERGPDQHDTAARLFEAIYGPYDPRPISPERTDRAVG